MLVCSGGYCKARVAALLVLAAGFCRADVLNLTDGTRYSGRLVRESPEAVLFEIVMSDGRSSVQRVFSRERVKSIERGPLALETNRAAERDDAGEKWSSRDAEQVLREAFELLDGDDTPAALRALQRLVNRTAEEQLPSLNDLCKRERNVPLDELLAQTRMRYALSQRTGQLFSLTGVTKFESKALSKILANKAETALQADHGGRSVASWAQTPDEYNRLEPDALALVRDARLAGAFVGARLKVDEDFQQDSAERRRLRLLREGLSRLVVHVTSMHGYTGLGAGADDRDDPTIDEARNLATRPATTRLTDSAPTDERPDGDAVDGERP